MMWKWHTKEVHLKEFLIHNQKNKTMGRPRKELTPDETLELEDKLNEANAKLAATVPDKPIKPQPYSRSEIADFKKDGHLVGKADQPLVLGHNEEDLQCWELVKCEMRTMLQTIPEVGKEWAVPVSITPTRIEKPNMRGNDKTFQAMNNQIDFRYRREDALFYYLPKGYLEMSKTYDCSYWVEIQNRGRVDETRHVRLDVIGFPRITGKK